MQDTKNASVEKLTAEPWSKSDLLEDERLHARIDCRFNPEIAPWLSEMERKHLRWGALAELRRLEKAASPQTTIATTEQVLQSLPTTEKRGRGIPSVKAAAIRKYIAEHPGIVKRFFASRDSRRQAAWEISNQVNGTKPNEKAERNVTQHLGRYYPSRSMNNRPEGRGRKQS